MLLEQQADQGVLTVTMKGPKLTPLTFESYAEMRDLFSRLDLASGIRAVVLTGSMSEVKPGKERPAFCSGGSVDGIIGPLLQKSQQEVREFAELTCDLVRKMRECPQPIIASIDGYAAGAGAILALASDFRIATTRSNIAFLFTHVGLSGDDMGAAYLLKEMIGRTHATDWLMTGRTIKPEEALSRGFLNKIVEPEALPDVVQKLAQGLARLPLEGLADTKKGLDYRGLEEALKRAAEAQANLMGDPAHNADFREFHTAFTGSEKRAPQFNGAPGPLDPKAFEL